MPAKMAVRHSSKLGAGDLAKVRKIADFILKLQNKDGRIADDPESAISNEDSNAEYALMGLAAAYEATGQQRYLDGFERGISWLADRMELQESKFRGSFFYTYDVNAPYSHVPTSPGDGISDVRGVDATSALFVHLLARHYEVTGKRNLVDKYETHALAALDFVLRENRADDGFFYSSWQKQYGQWHLWKYQYAADQGDVYLGLRAGADLYETSTPGRYTAAANFLASHTSSAFFDSSQERYAVGREGGELDELGGIDGVFAQGYLPWIFGGHPSGTAAYNWLQKGVQPDGSLVLFRGDDKYALSGEVYALAAAALGHAVPKQTLKWLTTALLDAESGGIRDSLADDTTISNVAGFALLALTGATPRKMWENKIGGAGADILTGKNGINDVLNGLSGTDTLKGLNGNDVLIGGASRDVLTGGSGRDVFVFNTLQDSLTRAPDVITDFEKGRDYIDLSTLDAIKDTAANDPFKFIGDRAFGARKGELHYVRTNKSGTLDDKTFVEGDIDGDGKADFRIAIKGLISFAEGDFIL